MKNMVGIILVMGLLIGLMIWSTPVARLGSGFLIGNGPYVFTYHDLIMDAGNIQIKFPNEDNIPAKTVFMSEADNLAILELQEPPKVKREPLFFLEESSGSKENYVFSLGYPWTNTLEDKHTLLEGVLESLRENDSGLLEINMELDPIHSGSPLFNGNREVVGMVLSAITLRDRKGYSGTPNLAIPVRVLIDAMKANKLFENASPTLTHKKLSIEEFVEAVRNNVVLIEAR